MAAFENSASFLSRNRWIAWAVGIVAAVILLASFMSHDEIVPVRAATVQRTTMRSVVSTNGKIEPIQNFEAHAPIGTTVKRVLVKEGDHVKKGQLLVQLNDAEARNQAAKALSQVKNSEADVQAVQTGGTHEEVLTLQAQLVKARADRDAAQRNLAALQRLQQSGAATPGELKDAQAQFDTAEANLKLLQQKQDARYSRPEVARVDAQKTEAQTAYSAAENVLGQLNIKAPFDGTVYALPVREGNYLNPGDLILQEADLSRVLVRVFVDEPDVGRLAPAQKIEITWDALPGRVWTGQLAAVPSAVKLHGTRNVGEATSIIENTDLKLLPNINIGATIVTIEDPNALAVPREAVRQEEGKSYVYQVVNDELQRRDVQTSISNLTQVEVKSGIDENSLVAIASTNSKPLRSGLPVKVIH
ncbi:MAG TPA: efflux RND transporter periplasmic adaptor subunit [Terriglobales bacterium]|jgi:HlyD family secretion protein